MCMRTMTRMTRRAVGDRMRIAHILKSWLISRVNSLRIWILMNVNMACICAAISFT